MVIAVGVVALPDRTLDEPADSIAAPCNDDYDPRRCYDHGSTNHLLVCRTDDDDSLDGIGESASGCVPNGAGGPVVGPLHRA